jgi:hypothetical protein
MNKYRSNEPQVEEELVETPIASATPPAKGITASAFNNWFDSFSAKDSAIKILPFILFLAAIGMFYIGNKHMAEKNIRNIEKINKDLKELKWEYMTAKSELMFKSKQTELAKVTELFGLVEATVPPQKIVLQKK